MLAPLVVLAVLAVVGGYVGVPHALGGHNYFEKFLEPVFSAGLPEVAGGHGDEATLERGLTLLSVLAGAVGFLLAWLLYWKSPGLPGRITASVGALYRAVAGKYYVDEGYDAVFVRPVVEGSTNVLWRGIDVALIDDSVNALASGARSVSGAFRRMQSGNLRSYAGWVVAGAALILAYMVWVGVR
jgi:NADH-quinone oxidoreductase subunit L